MSVRGQGRKATRWGEEERELSQKYLNGGGKVKVDLDRLDQSADYRAEIQRLEPVFMRHNFKNYTNGIKRAILKFKAEQERRGQRRSAGAFAAGAEEVSSGDEEDYEEERTTRFDLSDSENESSSKSDCHLCLFLVSLTHVLLFMML